MYNISRTDIECQWKKKKTTETTSKSIAEMYPPSKPDYVALTRKPTAADRARLYEKLKMYGKFTGLCWILSPEPQPAPQMLSIPTIEEVIFSEDFLVLQGINAQRAFIAEKFEITDQVNKEITQQTVGQRDNPLWHLAKKRTTDCQ